MGKLPELSEIKELRRRARLTQKELAEIVGCSWSMVAKIEAGTNVPSYDLAKEIFRSLENVIEKRTGKEYDREAHQIMTPSEKMITAKPDDSLNSVIDKMVSYNVSQVPIIDSGKCVGSITDMVFVEHPIERERVSLTVKDVMKDPFPTVPKNMRKRTLANILRHYQAIIVMEGKEIIGIITKEDLIKE